MAERTAAEMDQAAEKAEEALDKLREEQPEAVAAVAAWWKEHYLSAGHKRLARLLLQQAPARKR